MTWRDHDTAKSHFIASTDEPGLMLHIRAHADSPSRAPVLFVHGATYASRLYDIPHPGASWMKATAEAGFAAYGLDIRGYGKSRSTAMETTTAPYARASDAIRDIDDAVAWISARHGVASVRLIGGSWGSITTALFAATVGAGRVEKLVLYAPIFAEVNEGWRGVLADPTDTTQFNPSFGATRLITEPATRERWDAEIPDGADWRDEGVFQALVLSSFADDPKSMAQTPPAFRAPNGTFVDLWEVFNARPLYDPTKVLCPTLLIRGGADPTSTRSDALCLFDRLGATEKEYVEIAHGAHFVSAERRAPRIFSTTSWFLQL